MASADLRQELDCSICLNIYTDPVTLRCGHNFCRVCIDRVLDTQEGSGVYTCPECRAECQQRPALQRNITLCNIVGSFLSTWPDQEETGIFCTYCIHSPVPAVKSCLLCEASLCDNHLRVHSMLAEHVLSDPTTSLGNRKCSIHKKILEYYCTEDAACICVSCSLAGEHRGHRVEMLDEASKKKKEKLRNVLQKLTTKREETEKRVQRQQERRREDQEKAVGVTERVTALFRDIRRQLEDLEKRVLSEISSQEESVSLSVSALIQQLEIKKDELSRKMHHIEELCNMSDPVTVLQEPDTGDFCDTEDRKRHYNQVHGVGDLDVNLISETLQTGLSDIITGINVWVYVQEPTDILLDVNTAANYIHISGDRKTVSSSPNQKRPETPERFQYNQVLSTRRFSSGRHYWEVEISKSGYWRVGMCYPSIDRRGRQSDIGNNKKSWCLCGYNNQYSVRHDWKVIRLLHNIPCDIVRIYLDYEAGQLSFYSLCDPIRHLHTVTATFTEPLHAALWVERGCIKISGGVRSLEKLGSLLSTQPDQEETGIFCTYCIHSPVPAAKSCLHCEASLCDNHLRVHSKSAEHVLCDPTTSLENRKCSVHKKILEYYCTEDAACICVSCSLAGEHQGHLVEMLDEAADKKKEKLRNVLQKLTRKREETEKRVQSLQERRREDQEKAAGVTETVTALFSDIRRQLEDIEKRVLCEISRQEESVSLPVSDLIQQLEIKKNELSRKMRHIEELCNMSDPVTVLQEPDTGDLCDTEDRERQDDQVHGVGDLDVGLISGKLHTLSDIITGINIGIYVQELTDILLDVNTAANNIRISDDRKTASRSPNQNRPEIPERFQYYQVISTRRFSSGRHYWEVDVSKSGEWRVGICYPSIDRRGDQSYIGKNNKSWCLCGEYNNDNQYKVRHDRKVIQLPDNIPCDRVRIYLDYEAGQMSFYALCDRIRHLHTVTATFTEPLHAALWVLGGCIKISGGVRSWEK
ncbi:E3 ubiquitin/ISG15 ligase TRIM25-like [Mixophyes fleayi]|uniref:E3 ubiquitin/ISG15 ligase TRIM25-like n=1 Tax=Mixophyes fleayi TaxID=3061075 RepID=UPI003F4DF995